MLDAFFGGFLQAFLDGFIEGRGYLDIKAAPDKSEPKRFAGQFRQLYADAAADAFSGFENDAAWLHELREGPPLLPIPARIHLIDLSIMLQHAVARGTTIAVQTARRFGRGLGAVEAGAGVARTNAASRT